jgi:hypothetical protein
LILCWDSYLNGQVADRWVNFKLFLVYFRFFVSKPVRKLERIVPWESNSIIVIKMFEP